MLLEVGVVTPNGIESFRRKFQQYIEILWNDVQLAAKMQVLLAGVRPFSRVLRRALKRSKCTLNLVERVLGWWIADSALFLPRCHHILLSVFNVRHWQRSQSESARIVICDAIMVSSKFKSSSSCAFAHRRPEIVGESAYRNAIKT